MRLAITGGSGFLGAHLVRLALERGHEVVLLLRPGGDRRNLEGLSVSIAEGLLEGPLPEGFPAGADAVIHLAALYAEGQDEEERLFSINAEASGRLARASAEAGVPRFLHVSTMGTIVPTADNRVAVESDRVDPERASAYARSKLAGEEAVLAVPGIEVVIVNPAAPVGRFDLKPSVSGQRIAGVVRGERPRLVSGPVAHVPARGCAEGILLALERGRDRERYLLGGENLESEEFLERVAQAAGVKVPRAGLWERFKEGRRPRVGLAIDDGKAREELGYDPGDLDEAFRDAVRWFRGD